MVGTRSWPDPARVGRAQGHRVSDSTVGRFAADLLKYGLIAAVAAFIQARTVRHPRRAHAQRSRKDRTKRCLSVRVGRCLAVAPAARVPDRPIAAMPFTLKAIRSDGSSELPPGNRQSPGAGEGAKPPPLNR